MPWVIKKDGDEWCVYKESPDGGPMGETLGCHDTEQGAKDQLAALYASEQNSRQINLQVDVRSNELRFTEVRFDIKDHKLSGYAALFNQTSENFGGWVERIAPGAFAESLKETRDIRALWQHDAAYVLGRTTNGTLSVAEDATGLLTVITPPDTQWARDAVESIRRGDVNQMSFGFRVPEGGDRLDKRGDLLVRTVLRAQLIEVSPVTFPAYVQTSVSVRSIPIVGNDLVLDEISGNSRTLANLRRRLKLAEKSLGG